VEDSEDGLVVVLENYGKKTAVLQAGVAYLQFVAIQCYTGIITGIAGGEGRVCDYWATLPALTREEDPSPAAALPAAARGDGGGGGGGETSTTDDVGELLREELEVLVNGGGGRGAGGLVH
jgi:hypothetical protein